MCLAEQDILLFSLYFPIRNGIVSCREKPGNFLMRLCVSKFNITFCCLLLAALGLLALVPNSSVLAQDKKDGLILRDVTGGYNNEVMPGEIKTFFIEVENESNISTNDIRFTSDTPKEWMVEFKPASIDALNAGSYQTLEVSITAPRNVQKGNYSVTVIADSSIGRRVTGIYLRVENGTNLWMWVGCILGVIVIALFIFIFIRFSKD